MTYNAIAAKDSFSSNDYYKECILLVDDYVDHLELMTVILEQEGYRVVSSSEPKGVAGRIEEWAPDIAILDVMMPGMSGYELCRILKEGCKNKTKFFPVILVTGLAQSEDRITGIEAGADDFFSKPFNPKEIIVKIKSLLRLKRLQDELESTEDVIFTLATALEAKDLYTKGHSERVSAISVHVAAGLGFSEKEVIGIKKAGILHDIGKIGVHENILHKSGGLSDEERGIIRKHPVTGAEICKPLYSIRHILPAIRHHHERWDGGGFPDGLAGYGIPLLGRVISIADTFDAMVSVRPYRAGFPIDRALGIIKNEMNAGQWDPAMASEFIKMAGCNPDFIKGLYSDKT